MSKRLTDLEYQATFDLIHQTGAIALLIDPEHVRAVLAEIERTDTLMPMLDPTGWMKIAKNIPGHRRVVTAFLHFQSVCTAEIQASEEKKR